MFLSTTLAIRYVLPSNHHHMLHWRCQTFYVTCLLLGDLLLAFAQLFGHNGRGFACVTIGTYTQCTTFYNNNNNTTKLQILMLTAIPIQKSNCWNLMFTTNHLTVRKSKTESHLFSYLFHEIFTSKNPLTKYLFWPKESFSDSIGLGILLRVISEFMNFSWNNAVLASYLLNHLILQNGELFIITSFGYVLVGFHCANTIIRI